MNVGKLGDFLNQKYLEWQLTTGRKQSYQTFSKYLGVSYSTMMGWMNDTHPPSSDNLRKMAAKLGMEVYDFADQERPKDELAGLPPDLVRRWRAAFDEIKAELEQRGVPLDSPEAESISDAIMAKHGFIRKDISRPDDASV
jgi:transcriptional regulator with XRE-family HTH domain